MDWSIIVPPLVSTGYSLTGWLKNSLADGEIQDIEKKQLIDTFFGVNVVSFGVALGFRIDPAVASAMGILAYYMISQVRKISKK